MKTQPTLRITVEKGDQEIEYLVRPDNRDMVRWDLVRARKGWPHMRDAPFLYMTVQAWAALRREGHTDLDIEAFIESTVEVIAVNDDGTPLTAEQIIEGGEQVDPSQPDPGSGY